MGLTIGAQKNYLNCFSKSTNLTKSENLEELKESASDKSSNYHSGVFIKFDRANKTGYADGIKMDQNYMDILTMMSTGTSNAATILGRIDRVYEDTEAEKLKKMFGLI